MAEDGAHSSLNGRKIVITGAGRGYGAALAQALARENVRLILTGRWRETLGPVSAKIEAETGVVPETLTLDMSDPGQSTEAAEALARRHDSLDALIHCSSQWLAGASDEYDGLSVVMTVNAILTGTILVTRTLLPLVQANGGGDIVNLVSSYARPNAPTGGASIPWYAAKHGQAAATDALRHELADTNVRVIGIYPPEIEEAVSQQEADYDAARQAGRLVNASDVADGVIYALTRPRHLTVNTLVLGGMTASAAL